MEAGMQKRIDGRRRASDRQPARCPLEASGARRRGRRTDCSRPFRQSGAGSTRRRRRRLQAYRARSRWELPISMVAVMPAGCTSTACTVAPVVMRMEPLAGRGRQAGPSAGRRGERRDRELSSVTSASAPSGTRASARRLPASRRTIAGGRTARVSSPPSTPSRSRMRVAFGESCKPAPISRNCSETLEDPHAMPARREGEGGCEAGNAGPGDDDLKGPVGLHRMPGPAGRCSRRAMEVEAAFGARFGRLQRGIVTIER